MWKNFLINAIFKSMTSELAKKLIIDLLNWLVKKTKTDFDDKLVEKLVEYWESEKNLSNEEINV